MDQTQTDVNQELAVGASGVVDVATTENQSVQAASAPAEAVQAAAADVQQGASQQAAGIDQTQTLADGTAADKPVAYDRFKTVNDEKNAAVARNAELEAFIQAQQASVAAAPVAVQQASVAAQPTAFEQAMKNVGVTADELAYDGEAIVKVNNEKARLDNIATQQVQAVNAAQAQTQSFITSKSDYTDVVGKTDPVTRQFIAAPPLQRVLQANPGIQSALLSLNAVNPAQAAVMAYELASKDPTYAAAAAAAAVPAGVQQSQQAQQVIDQANGQVSISAVAGQGAIDKGAQLAAMDDQTFEQHKQSIINQA